MWKNFIIFIRSKPIHSFNWSLETVKGVVDSSKNIRLASSLGDSLLERGEAKIFDNELLADDAGYVPLITSGDPKNKMNPTNPNYPFVLRADLPSEKLTKIYGKCQGLKIFHSDDKECEGVTTREQDKKEKGNEN